MRFNHTWHREGHRVPRKIPSGAPQTNQATRHQESRARIIIIRRRSETMGRPRPAPSGPTEPQPLQRAFVWLRPIGEPVVNGIPSPATSPSLLSMTFDRCRRLESFCLLRINWLLTKRDGMRDRSDDLTLETVRQVLLFNERIVQVNWTRRWRAGEEARNERFRLLGRRKLEFSCPLVPRIYGTTVKVGRLCTYNKSVQYSDSEQQRF